MEKTIDECFFQIQNGANIKQGNANGGYPITRIETTANDRFNRDRMGYAGITDISKYESYVLEDGDLLMSHINSVQYLGRTVLYEKLEDETIIHGMNLLRLKAKRDIITPAFAKYCFYGQSFRSQVANITKKSVNQASFAVKDLKQIKIDVPEMGQQNRIVEILNKTNELMEKRQKELESLDKLIKARFVELFGDPSHNEKEWDIKDLVDVTTIVTYGLTVRPEYIDDGIDLVSARELHKGYVAYEEAPKISSEDFENLSDKGKPQKNDILFSKTGSIGHCALVEDEKPFAITQNAARIGLDIEKVNPVWLLHYLRMDYIQDWCKNHAKGNAVKDFQLQDMKIIPLFDCPLELQDSFTEFVRQVDKSKVAVKKALDETKLLFDSLMQKYFG